MKDARSPTSSTTTNQEMNPDSIPSLI